MTVEQEQVPAPPDDAAVLVIWLWREREHPSPMRARITYEDPATGERRSAAAADPERAIAVVADWWARFAAPGQDG